MKYSFVTDTHWFAPNAINTVFVEKNDILLGDIYDLRNCKKSKVPQILSLIEQMRNYALYLQDNHDAINGKVSDPQLIPNTKIAICGGSQIFWDEDRLHDYTNKEFGAGFLKRQIWVRALMLASKFVSDKISDNAMSRAVDIAKKLGASIVVCGHKHPNKILTRIHNGVTLYVLPRGKTVIDL